MFFFSIFSFYRRHHHLPKLYTENPTEFDVLDVMRGAHILYLIYCGKMAIVWVAQRSRTHTRWTMATAGYDISVFSSTLL